MLCCFLHFFWPCSKAEASHVPSWQCCFRNAKISNHPKVMAGRHTTNPLFGHPQFSHRCFSSHCTYCACVLPGFVHVYSFGLLYASVLISDLYIYTIICMYVYMFIYLCVYLHLTFYPLVFNGWNDIFATASWSVARASTHGMYRVFPEDVEKSYTIYRLHTV